MNLLELINRRANSLDMQYARAEMRTPDELGWIHAKQRVAEMSMRISDIEALVSRKILIPGAVEKTKFGRCGKDKCNEVTDVVTITLETSPYQMQLILYFCPRHDMKSANYVVLNNETNQAYIKNVLDKYEAAI